MRRCSLTKGLLYAETLVSSHYIDIQKHVSHDLIFMTIYKKKESEKANFFSCKKKRSDVSTVAQSPDDEVANLGRKIKRH